MIDPVTIGAIAAGAALLKNEPGLITMLYQDIAQPGAQQVGKALGGLLQFGNIILFANLEKFRSKIENVSPDDICDVPPEIGVPIMNKLGYVSDKELSEMYLNLIAKASVTWSAELAHPGFVSIIDRMCPDEAVLFREIAKKDVVPCISLLYGTNVEFRVFEPAVLKELTHPNNIDAYIMNLASLGLLTISNNTWGSHPDYRKVKEALASHPHNALAAAEGYVKTSAYGKLFTGACLKELQEK